MNNLRILGQILLWSGFLSASLAAVSRKEFDFLPSSEQEALLSLPDSASLARGEVQELAGKPLRDLTSDDLVALVEQIRPLVESKTQFQNQVDALSAKPLSQLSAEELSQLSQLLPQLQQQATQRQTDSEAGPASLSEAEMTRLRSAAQPLSRDDLIEQRIFTIDNRWPTVPWIWYGLSLAVGAAGVFCLRATAKSADQDSSRVESEYTVIQNSLAELRSAVHGLSSELDGMRPSQVVNFIDMRLAAPFADFADARNALIQRFGLQAFADVMTHFSSAERFANRAWSAAADGYMGEVRNCVQIAEHHLEQAGLAIARAEEARTKLL